MMWVCMLRCILGPMWVYTWGYDVCDVTWYELIHWFTLVKVDIGLYLTDIWLFTTAPYLSLGCVNVGDFLMYMDVICAWALVLVHVCDVLMHVGLGTGAWVPIHVWVDMYMDMMYVRPYVSYFPFSLVEIDIQVYLSPICQLVDILAWIGVWMLFCYSHGILIYLGYSPYVCMLGHVCMLHESYVSDSQGYVYILPPAVYLSS
jgi:hypothetical protein